MPQTAESPAGSTGLLTVGQLAELLGVSQAQVKYAVARCRIQPVGRVGIIRVWGQDAIPLIRSALERIAANRGESR